jgi:flagellar assembly factor FliW
MSAEPDQLPAVAARLTIATRDLGARTVGADEIITFPLGLAGFSQCRRYVLLAYPQPALLLCLQSVDREEVAFVVTDPANVVADYQPRAINGAMSALEITDSQDLLVLVILTIPPGHPEQTTANLQGPLAINTRLHRGKQLILEDSRYSLKHRILVK